MSAKTDRFDCVEMKNRIQRELREKYESRRDEFSSYGEFINATVMESPELKEFIKNIRKDSRS